MTAPHTESCIETCTAPVEEKLSVKAQGDSLFYMK